MDEYVETVGSLNPDQLEDKSLKDIKKLVKNEIKSHEETLADRTDETVRIFLPIKKISRRISRMSFQNSSPFKFYAYMTKESISGVLIPLFDMGSDVATAVTHYRWENYGWCILTLVFVALPGLVCGLAITIKGLRKQVSAQRIVNYSVFLCAITLLYPFIQIFL